MSAIIAGQTVVSHLLPQQGQTSYMAFTTRLGTKTVITGGGIGRCVDGGMKATPVAQGVFNAIEAHCTGEIIICECRNAATARQRVIDALIATKDGDGLFVLSKDVEIHERVLLPELLGLERTPSETGEPP